MLANLISGRRGRGVNVDVNAHQEGLLFLVFGIELSRNFELFRCDIHAVLRGIRLVCAFLVPGTHGAGAVSLVVSAIDLLGGQAQATTRQHWLCRFEHDGGIYVLLLEDRIAEVEMFARAEVGRTKLGE